MLQERKKNKVKQLKEKYFKRLIKVHGLKMYYRQSKSLFWVGPVKEQLAKEETWGCKKK